MIGKSLLIKGYRCTASNLTEEEKCPFYKRDDKTEACGGHRNGNRRRVDFNECHDQEAQIALEIQEL